MSNIFGVEKGPQICTDWPRNGVTIGGDAEKSANNNNLLVIMRVRLSQKIGLLDLTNRTRFKKGNGYKIRKKSVHDYWRMPLMLHIRSINHSHTNLDLLGGCLAYFDSKRYLLMVIFKGTW